MPIVASPIPAAELAQLALDAPLFVANNVLRDRTAAIWCEAAAASGIVPGATDITLTDFPVEHATDLQGALVTRSGVPTQTRVGIVWTLNPGNDDAHSCDVLAILGHNFGSVAAATGNGIAYNFQVADTATFTSGLTSLASGAISPTDGDRRIVSLSLGTGNQRVQDMAFARLLLQSISFGSRPLEVGEVWLGRRRQVPFPPQRPVDLDHVRSMQTGEVYPGGYRITVEEYGGQHVADLQFLLRQDRNGTDARTVLRTLQAETGQGRPCLYCPRPNTEPGRTMIVEFPADLRMPETGFGVQEARLVCDEQPPFYARETATLVT